MNKSRKIFIRVTCVFLALLMALGLIFSVLPILAGAASRADLEKLKEEQKALEAEADELQKDIDVLENTQARYIDRKAALDKRIAVNQTEIDNIRQQITVYEEEIKDTRARLAEATAQEQAQYEQLRVRMRAMEESGTLTYIDILFNASSLTDFLSKAADINNIMHFDQDLQNEYVTVREDVETLKAELAEEQNGLQAVKSEMELKKAQLEAQTVAAYEMLANLEDDLDSYNKAIEENEAAEEELQTEIDELMKTLEKQEAAAAAAAAAAGGGSGGSSGGGGGSVAASGSYIWPTTSMYVTSSYGWRVHPIQGENKFHAGVDIGAGAGSNIYAASAGTVAAATYNSSYGNYVLINHGNGNSTLYAHMSSMAVSSGQYVSQGQVIGYVGSTGWSTGPHLHFEVRINGSTVNPLQYFSGYSVA